ncbi:hypothetical protein [Streptomyces sp. WAC 06738]|uniref:hypothetical protein n=1 Tax=Streptomyces sp. WAC 06738 TaxID=2203210 RepID=UPI0019D1DA79|nr:hypothetical protein [Streptomyces sp. WAC 06738]
MTALQLVVADHVAGRLYVYDPYAGRLLARLDGRHLAEHAGFLRLSGGRVAFVDDLAGEVVVLDPVAPGEGRPLVAATAPVAVPAEHIAADPTGRHLAVTTGCGRSWEPWSDLTTVVDLAPERPYAPRESGGHRPRAVRVRTRVDEPGVVLLGTDDPLVVLRHRMPGALAAHRLHDLLDAGPGCPRAEPYERLLFPGDGHGDAVDPTAERLFTATGAGVHRARRDGRTLTAESPLSWDTAGRGGGRGYYLRLDPRGRVLWSTVRVDTTGPERWPEWPNDAWWHHLDSGRTGRVELGPGLVFRLALAAGRAAFTRIHPDGDELILLNTGTGPVPSASPRTAAADGPSVAARLALPPMNGAPRRGGTPWDGVQRRAVAASPGGDLVAVTRGGHGEIHIVDASTGVLRHTIRTPTPLDEGGHLALTGTEDGAEADTVGR